MGLDSGAARSCRSGSVTTASTAPTRSRFSPPSRGRTPSSFWPHWSRCCASPHEKPLRPSQPRPERTLLHMSADERVLSEAVDGAAAEVVAPPDHAPLARQTLAYGLSGLLVPLAGMITLPIFARTFSQSQYGILELATTTLTAA